MEIIDHSAEVAIYSDLAVLSVIVTGFFLNILLNKFRKFRKFRPCKISLAFFYELVFHGIEYSRKVMRLTCKDYIFAVKVIIQELLILFRGKAHT